MNFCGAVIFLGFAGYSFYLAYTGENDWRLFIHNKLIAVIFEPQYLKTILSLYFLVKVMFDLNFYRVCLLRVVPNKHGRTEDEPKHHYNYKWNCSSFESFWDWRILATGSSCRQSLPCVWHIETDAQRLLKYWGILQIDFSFILKESMHLATFYRQFKHGCASHRFFQLYDVLCDRAWKDWRGPG